MLDRRRDRRRRPARDGAQFDPATFWEEVRRYGVTVASYTWTMLHELVDAPAAARRAPPPGTAVHGLGDAAQPVAPGRAALRARARARVLRLDRERGDPGQRRQRQARLDGPAPARLPEVRLAAYDADNGPAGARRRRLRPSLRSGRARVSCSRGRGEIDSVATTPLRGVFAGTTAGCRPATSSASDADGDLWRLDGAFDVIRTAHGAVFTTPIREALGDLPAVDLAVAYGLAAGHGRAELAVAAVTLRAGYELDARELTHAMRGLARDERPAIVHVVDEIPVTTWYRPIAGPLRDAGLPPAGRPGVLPRRRWRAISAADRGRARAAGRREGLKAGAAPLRRAASRPSRACGP